MAGYSDVFIHHDLFPTGWLRDPYHGQPVRPIAGPEAGVQRRVVRRMFPRYYFPFLRTPVAGDDDHWAASTTAWLRRVHRLRQTIADYPDIPADLVDRLGRCSPAGYQLENPHSRPRWDCRLPVCLFCYARQAAARYLRLVDARRRAPAGRPLWLARVVVVGGPGALRVRLRELGVAGAVASVVPGSGDEAGLWVHRAVALTDHRPRTAAAGYRTERWAGERRAVAAFSDWLRYPVRWRGRRGVLGLVAAIRAVAEYRPGGRRGVSFWVALGAARADYVPGRGALDFAAREPG